MAPACHHIVGNLAPSEETLSSHGKLRPRAGVQELWKIPGDRRYLRLSFELYEGSLAVRPHTRAVRTLFNAPTSLPRPGILLTSPARPRRSPALRKGLAGLRVAACTRRCAVRTSTGAIAPIEGPQISIAETFRERVTRSRGYTRGYKLGGGR